MNNYTFKKRKTKTDPNVYNFRERKRKTELDKNIYNPKENKNMGKYDNYQLLKTDILQKIGNVSNGNSTENDSKKLLIDYINYVSESINDSL